jgi:phospholipid/cholesterol/gamma-HCH transport system ATP-binding protein
VHESFTIADYVYVLSEGAIVAQGTPDDMRASNHPYVQQFVNAKTDGPVPFHYPGKTLAEDFGVGGSGA